MLMNPAARVVPRSFSPATKSRAVPSYANGDQAVRKASALPRHSGQRGDGTTAGAPQRPHRGPRRATSDDRQEAQTTAPESSGSRQPAQSGGTTSEISLSRISAGTGATIQEILIRLQSRLQEFAGE